MLYKRYVIINTEAQLPLVKRVTAPTPICCGSLIDCTVFLCWRVTHCFLSFVFLFFFLLSCFFIFFFLYFCPMLFTPEMRSSKYSSKWCGFLSCCLCPSVSACLFLPVGFSFLLPLVRFLPSLFVWFSFVFLSFLGVTELRLSELSVCYWTVHMSLWLTALINLYPGSAYTGHVNNISAPKWTLHLTLSVSFLLPRQLSALAELLRIELMGMEHYYSLCCA